MKLITKKQAMNTAHAANEAEKGEGFILEAPESIAAELAVRNLMERRGIIVGARSIGRRYFLAHAKGSWMMRQYPAPDPLGRIRTRAIFIRDEPLQTIADAMKDDWDLWYLPGNCPDRRGSSRLRKPEEG